MSETIYKKTTRWYREYRFELLDDWDIPLGSLIAVCAVFIAAYSSPLFESFLNFNPLVYLIFLVSSGASILFLKMEKPSDHPRIVIFRNMLKGYCVIIGVLSAMIIINLPERIHDIFNLVS